jgi:arginase
MDRPVKLILVPYDSAHRDRRMGRGPAALLAAGLQERLQQDGTDLTVAEVHADSDFLAEIATTFELQRRTRHEVEGAQAVRALPITLSGNCNTGVIGSLAASPGDDVGLIWFDAHSEAETPESTTSGFLDGMGLAMALHRCWSAALDGVGSWSLDGLRSALIGVREISEAAGTLLHDAGVALVTPDQARRGQVDSVIDRFRSAGVRRIHLHVDLDVLDADVAGVANGYALPDGLSGDQLLALVERLSGAFPLSSASIASYDPDSDPGGVVASIGVEVAVRLARSGAG